MTFENFDKVFDDLIAKCRTMRDTKGKEYANTQEDRLANFKELANELGVVSLGQVKLTLQNARKQFIKNSQTGLYSDLENWDAALEGIINEIALEPDPKIILMIYFMKHIRSIEAWIKNGEISSEERIEGRIIDAITYLTLLWGLENDK